MRTASERAARREPAESSALSIGFRMPESFDRVELGFRSANRAAETGHASTDSRLPLGERVSSHNERRDTVRRPSAVSLFRAITPATGLAAG